MNAYVDSLLSFSILGTVSRSVVYALALWIGGASAQEISRGPYLQQGAPTSMVVRWRTNTPTETLLEYRTFSNSVAGAFKSSVLTTEHEAKLTGLAPHTRYYYQIKTHAKVLAGGDPEHSFVTSPVGAEESIRIWLLGDAGSSGRLPRGEDPLQAAVRDAFLRQHPVADFDFIMMLGDNAYETGTDEEYQRGFFEPYRSVLRSKVVWPTQGNHDHTAKAYYPVFTLPTRGESGGVPSGVERFYSFEYGNAHFISLNSEIADPSLRESMMTWLRKDLAANKKPWTIVFWHHPPYSKGHHDSDDLKDSGGRMAWMRERIVPILDQAGVDLVFTGHSHSYERSKFIARYYGVANEFSESNVVQQGSDDDEKGTVYTKELTAKSPYSGTVYVCAGNAGKLEPGPLDHPAMAVSQERSGSVLLSINANEAHAAMIGADGKTEDSFTIRKGAGR
jgi:hypothetical protein